MSLRDFFTIYAAALRLGANKVLQYRGDSVIAAVGEATIQSAALVGVVTIASVAGGGIGGWGLHNIVLLYSFFLMVRAIAQALFDGVWNIGNVYIRAGRLDLLLVRPVSPFFQLICNRFEFTSFGFFFLGIGMSIWSLSRLGIGFSIGLLCIYVLFVICGVILTTSLYLIFNGLNFWLVQGNEITQVMLNVQEFSKYPLHVFPVAVQVLLTFIIPFSVTTYYPTAVLTGHMGPLAVLYLLMVTAVFAFIASLVWRLGLKSYNSTGS